MSDTQVRPPIEEVELSLRGMTCGACAARIQKDLNDLDGVEAAVNYATESATVVYVPGKVSPESLIATVQSAGYDAEVRTDESVDESLDEKLAKLRVRLWVCVALTVPVVAISMVSAWQFDNWQWVVAFLSLPVVTWGAWPFQHAHFDRCSRG